MLTSKLKIISLLHEFKSELSLKYSISKIGIFGSYARDVASGESDVDIVVEMEPDLFKRASLKFELEEIFQKHVDVIRYSANMNPHLKQRIDQEAFYV